MTFFYKHRRYVIFLLLIIIFCSDAFAQRRKRRDPFEKPQFGIWFGPVAPLFELSEEVQSAIGIGAYGRINTPFKAFKVGLDASYQNQTSQGLEEIQLIPVYGNVIYRLPIPSPLNFQLKAGAGTGHITVMPDDKSQFDPLFMTGAEMSFPAGKFVNIGLRIDYLFLYEKHLKNAELNGHFLNVGLMLYFNIFL